jgi:hypothetical protein
MYKRIQKKFVSAKLTHSQYDHELPDTVNVFSSHDSGQLQKPPAGFDKPFLSKSFWIFWINEFEVLKESRHTVFVNLTNEADFNIMLDGVHLTIVDSRFQSQFLTGTFALNPHRS